MTRSTMILRLIAWLLLAMISNPAGAWHPLEPVDTSSPRATIASLIALTDDLAQRMLEHRQSPSRTTQDRAIRIGDKAAGLLDLSQVPPAARDEVAVDTLFLLREVMARIELPDLEEIPGPEVDRTKGEDAEPLARWRVPRTEITLVRVEEGPRTGDYLFSADTVARALSFYQAVKDLPYRQPMPLENLYLSLETATGWMIPPAWVEALPDWANFRILDQVLWKWIALLLLVSVAVIVSVAVFRWSRGESAGRFPGVLPNPPQHSLNGRCPRAARLPAGRRSACPERNG